MPGNTIKKEIAQRKRWSKKRSVRMHILRRDERMANEGEIVTETRPMVHTEVRILRNKSCILTAKILLLDRTK